MLLDFKHLFLFVSLGSPYRRSWNESEKKEIYTEFVSDASPMPTMEGRMSQVTESLVSDRNEARKSGARTKQTARISTPAADMLPCFEDMNIESMAPMKSAPEQSLMSPSQNVPEAMFHAAPPPLSPASFRRIAETSDALKRFSPTKAKVQFVDASVDLEKERIDTNECMSGGSHLSLHKNKKKKGKAPPSTTADDLLTLDKPVNSHSIQETAARRGRGGARTRQTARKSAPAADMLLCFEDKSIESMPPMKSARERSPPSVGVLPPAPPPPPSASFRAMTGMSYAAQPFQSPPRSAMVPMAKGFAAKASADPNAEKGRALSQPQISNAPLSMASTEMPMGPPMAMMQECLDFMPLQPSEITDSGGLSLAPASLLEASVPGLRKKSCKKPAAATIAAKPETGKVSSPVSWRTAGYSAKAEKTAKGPAKSAKKAPIPMQLTGALASPVSERSRSGRLRQAAVVTRGVGEAVGL